MCCIDRLKSQPIAAVSDFLQIMRTLVHIERAVLSILLCLGVLLPVISSADKQLFIDKGVCPGERCTYCELFVAEQDFTIFQSPSRLSETVGAIAKGDAFISKTGEVHTLPQRLNVLKEHGIFRPGDELFILTYTGEAHYRARHNGKLIDSVELNNHPWSESSPYWYSCDEDNTYCWGTISGPIQSVWWIYVQSEKGKEGWIAYLDSFTSDDK